MQTPVVIIEAKQHGNASPIGGIPHSVPPGDLDTQLFRGRIHKKWGRSVDFFFSQHWSVLFRENMLHLSPKFIQSEGEHAIMSGYLKEPRATLFIRTGLHEAKTVLVPNLGRISILAAPHGLKVETVDEKVGHGQV
jgi:hypothetical protein